MDNPLLVSVVIVAVWAVPPIIMWSRGRMNWAAISLWLPFISLLILVKVVRQPATPDSWWAERFYGEHMMEVSRKRFPFAAIGGTRSEKKSTTQESRTNRRQRKYRRNARMSNRRAKYKAKTKAHRRPTDDIKDAKARDKKESR